MQESKAPNDAGLHVLKQGKILGPFTLESIHAAVARGEFSAQDFVQLEGVPMWQPLARVLEISEPEEQTATAPGWRSILKWAVWRLRRDVGEGSMACGLICALIGTGILLLVRWPAVLWLPWFALAVLVGFLALIRGRILAATCVLLAVAAVPVASVWLRPDQKPPAEPVTAVAAATPPPAAPAPVLAAAPLPVPPEPVKPDVKPDVENAVMKPVSLESALAASTPPAPETLPLVASTPKPPPLPALPPPHPAEPPPAEPFDANFLQRYSGALVLVNGAQGSGSGFVCRYDGQVRLLTNIHVLAGMKQPKFTSLDGTIITPGAGEAAVGHDILRLALAAPAGPALDVAKNLESTVKIGDEIVVLGNSGGGGVVTKLDGKLVGLGPDRLEVDAEFIPGNSGSPIIHVASGKVIGIATYLTRRYEEFRGGGSKETPVIRRFGYRLDKVKEWQSIYWPVFQAEADQVHRIEELTGDIFDFLGSLRKKQHTDFATDTLRRPATQWLATIRRGQLSPSDREQATRGFLSTLKAMVRNDVTVADGHLRYQFFRERLAHEREVRNRLYEAFDEEAKDLASPVGRTGY